MTVAMIEPPPAPGAATLNDRVVRLEVISQQTTTQVNANALAIDRLAKQMQSRPSWAVASMLSFMAGTIGVLATALAAHAT